MKRSLARCRASSAWMSRWRASEASAKSRSPSSLSTARHSGHDRTVGTVLAFLELDARPVLQHLVGVLHREIAEDVRVAADHLFGDAADDVLDGEQRSEE